jgi:HAD superfamily hydrolase (TIGR01509 family)
LFHNAIVAIKGLVFDFDGLILDTEVPTLQAWQEIYAEHGVELPVDVWVERIGHRPGGSELWDPHAHLERQLGRPLARDELRVRRRSRVDALIAAQPVLPGVEVCLADARRLGLKLAVASSSPRDWVDTHLARLGLLGHFACTKCGDDVPEGKPDPAVYLAAVEALGIAPHEAIAFEDSPAGLWAAKRAGLFAVAVPNPVTHRLPLDHADLRLRSLDEVPLAGVIALAEGRTPFAVGSVRSSAGGSERLPD